MRLKNFKTQSTQSAFLGNDAEGNKEFEEKTLRFSASFALKNFFLTPAGFAVLLISLIILIRALLARNAYEIVLSSVFLLLLLVLGIIGARCARKLAELEPGWKPPYPFTACAGEPTIISGLEANIPLFFRLHFVVCGYYSPSSSAPLRLRARSETSVSRGENTAELKMDFPMSGIFTGTGIIKLRDIFGFFSFSCGKKISRTLNIRSSPCYGKDYFINAQSGAEDKRNRHSPDEERYYMREYTPGDRFRDINWKSSEKIDSLITRISPDNQEKVSRIEIYFRNYCTNEKPSPEELWLLDRAKAILSHFLRSIKKIQPSFIFDIRSAHNEWEIEDEESMDAFLEELAGTGFFPLQNEETVNAKNGEIYVFSTACDTGLPSFLLASFARQVSLFLVQGTKDGGSFSKSEAKRFTFEQKPLSPEFLYKRDFLLKGIIPNPKWLFHKKINTMNVNANRTEIIYAETRL